MRRRKKPTSTAGRFRRDVALLREMCPPLLPVKVYRRKVKDVLGTTHLVRDAEGRPSHFIIAVANDISWDATWQVLIHEWAHAVAWNEGHDTACDHDPEWAIALSRIYQDTVHI